MALAIIKLIECVFCRAEKQRMIENSAARRIAATCAVLLLATAHTAQAGINVWTGHGPGTVRIDALAVDPTTAGMKFCGECGAA
jgi:hypothetical protein